MNISALKSQNMSEYITLLSNPFFLKAVKSAANEDDNGGKYDALLENLEKLSNLLSGSNDGNISESSDIIPGFGSSTPTADEATLKQDEKLRQLVDKLITNADLLESMLDLEVTPTDDAEISLFSKFQEIIEELDKAIREMQNNLKAKKVKEVYRLKPSSDTKSGFAEGIALLAQ